MTKADSTITLRKAVISDAHFIASTIISAMGLQESDNPSLIEALSAACTSEETIYSYRNTTMALYGSERAGALISYDGALYDRESANTFTLVSSYLGTRSFSPGKETGSGEYYLDSMSVLPQFRGHSIGSILISNALEEADALGFDRVALIADVKKPWLKSLYSRLGFKVESETVFMGEPYYRMVQYIH